MPLNYGAAGDATPVPERESIAEKGKCMTRDFLQEMGWEKDVIDKVMAEHGKGVEAAKKQLADAQQERDALTLERDALRKQLNENEKEIQSYKEMDIDGVKAAASSWEEKHKTDTEALNQQIAALKYEHAVAGAVQDVKFSSESARKAFVSDLTAKGLPLEDGKLMGLADFVKGYKESDPGAFVDENAAPKPVFAGPAPGIKTGVGADVALRAAFGLPTTEKE